MIIENTLLQCYYRFRYETEFVKNEDKTFAEIVHAIPIARVKEIGNRRCFTRHTHDLTTNRHTRQEITR
jgi:hypothetical protein